MKRTPTKSWVAFCLTRLAWTTLGLTTLALPACGGDDEAEAEVPELGATTSVTIEGDEGGEVIIGEPSAAAQHGGVTLSVGPHPLELVATQEGEVTVYATGAEPPPPAQTQLVVQLPADDGAVHPVTLIWDPGASAYRGRLYSANPMPGPVQVELTVGADPYIGRSPRYVLHGAPPEVEVDVEAPRRPAVVVEGPARPEVVVERPTVVVERPAPPPRPTIVVQRPDPRPTVVVEHRAPRGNVVVQPRRGRSRAGRVRVARPRARGRVRVR